MDRQIEVDGVVEAVEQSEGAGARVLRVFPTRQLGHVDPFVLLDEFTVTPPASFPDHPHGGFEGVTYMLEGAFRHRDNLGNDEIVSAGGVQRFTAGERIVHAELPGSDATSRGIQLWVNLPKRLKKIEPDYQLAGRERIPETEEGGTRMRTVLGGGSPIELHTEVEWLDVTVESGPTSFRREIREGWNGLVYVLEGQISLRDRAIERAEAAVFGGGGEAQVRADSPARFLLLAGKPHGEPIHQRGSFVK